MFVIKNILRVYQLARHSIINFFFPKKKIFEDEMMESLYLKGYYMCHENDIDYNNLGSIVKKSIKKYFPSQTGDTRLYGIDDENLIIKHNFHKIINNHKYRIKNISTIKKLYLHCTMGGFLQNAEKVSSGGGWHRDHHFELFKVMVYLSDVDKNNGPFSYIENYTENKKILHERSNHMNIPENLIKQSIKEFVIL